MTSFQSITDILNRLAAAMEFGGGAIFIIGILATALWRQTIFLYAVSFFVTLAIAFSWAKLYPGLSFGLMVLAAYDGISILKIAFEGDKTPKGISQFKGVIERLKDWF